MHAHLLAECSMEELESYKSYKKHNIYITHFARTNSCQFPMAAKTLFCECVAETFLETKECYTMSYMLYELP